MSSNPQRLAWATMLGALVIFCVLCAGTATFLRWFVFESPTRLAVTLYVGTGTVGLAEPNTSDEKAIRSPAQVEDEDRLSTDSNTQGYLAFSDPYSNTVIATVMLRNDSVVTLDHANRPRFSLSDNPYAIRLIGANGRFEVWVNSALDRTITLEVESPLGITRIREGGSYFIDSNPAYLQVTARDGQATLIGLDGQTQQIAQSMQATLRPGAPMVLADAPIDLLPNSNFGQSEGWAKEWKCFFDPLDNPNGPSGHWSFEKVAGRPAIHIVRLQPNPGPGRTGCLQSFGDPARKEGIALTPYASLRLRVTMQVHYQKLSGCGAQGSECPVMLEMTYFDQNGNERIWRHGFYAEYTPNVGRTTCDTCSEPHEKINKDAWYTYESGNLFTDWPEDRRPAVINEIKFYAEGHEVEVTLAEVSLLAAMPGQEVAATGP